MTDDVRFLPLFHQLLSVHPIPYCVAHIITLEDPNGSTERETIANAAEKQGIAFSTDSEDSASTLLDVDIVVCWLGESRDTDARYTMKTAPRLGEIKVHMDWNTGAWTVTRTESPISHARQATTTHVKSGNISENTSSPTEVQTPDLSTIFSNCYCQMNLLTRRSLMISIDLPSIDSPCLEIVEEFQRNDWFISNQTTMPATFRSNWHCVLFRHAATASSSTVSEADPTTQAWKHIVFEGPTDLHQLLKEATSPYFFHSLLQLQIHPSITLAWPAGSSRMAGSANRLPLTAFADEAALLTPPSISNPLPVEALQFAWDLRRHFKCHSVKHPLESQAWSPPSPELQTAVDIYWQEQLQHHPRMFDGRATILNRQGTVSEIPYRFARACLFGKMGRKVLGPCALGVLGCTGLVTGPGGKLLLGLRRDNLLWEAVPAGTLPPAQWEDPLQLVLAELAEEFPCPLQVDAMAVLGAAYDRSCTCYDLLYWLQCRECLLPPTEGAHFDEHAQFQWMSTTEIISTHLPVTGPLYALVHGTDEDPTL